MSNFLQSNEWAEFQRSLGRAPLEVAAPRSFGLAILSRARLLTGREVFEYEKDGISAKVIRHNLPFGKNYLYIPHGPVMDPERGREGTPRTKQDAERVRGFVRGTQRASASYGMDFNAMTGGFKNPVANFVRWLREEAKKRKSIFVKTEPLTDSVAQALVEAGFKKSRKEIQPSKTVVIDLEQSEDELLGRMHHKTRYNIGVAEKHGIMVNEGNDVDSFLKLLRKTAKRDRFNPHPADYYKKLLEFFRNDRETQVKLFAATHPISNSRELENKKREGRILVAGAIILLYRSTAYYLHGASDYDYRSLMAPYALHWYIITSNQKLGTRNYDLWGIDAQKWPGVTRFKLGWGGRTIEYPGSFDLPISKFWYLVYRLARKIKKRD